MRMTPPPQFDRINLPETVHVADTTGVRCGDCGAAICGVKAQPYYPYEHVVVAMNDPCASWRTSREITCSRAVAYGDDPSGSGDPTSPGTR